MLKGRLLVSKRAISLCLCLLVLCAPANMFSRGEEIVQAPLRYIQECHFGYINKVKDIKSRVEMAHTVSSIPLVGSVATAMGAKLTGHTAQDLKNAAITLRFFNCGKAFTIVHDIGNLPTDAAYIASVYTEFFEGQSRSFERLVQIMHWRMMDALGFDRSTSIDQFMKMVQKKNSKGYYMYITGPAFDTFARLIALNLFITYWYDTRVA